MLFFKYKALCNKQFFWPCEAEETADLRSKFLTANINPKSRYEPYVFTETGIYMLMTVLNGELATLFRATGGTGLRTGPNKI